MAEQHRALQWLHLYGRRYPHAWELYAHLLADPPMNWPSWCWCPLAGAYAVLSGGCQLSADQAADIGPLGALAAWRATKGIYRVHPTLLHELLDTPVSGDLPSEVLTRLPEWCVYVETPEHKIWDLPLHGFWAYLESDANNARTELRLVLDMGEVTADARPGQVVIHLGGTIDDGIRAAVREARIQALRAGNADDAPSLAGIADGELAQHIGGLVSVLLYLCADDAEIEKRRELPPRIVRGKKRPIMPSAQAPVVHETGTRIGAALDLARQRLSAEGSQIGERSVLPHVRRAHWHRYWMGPRDGDRSIRLRWLSPILVGLDDVPGMATVHAVRDE